MRTLVMTIIEIRAGRGYEKYEKTYLKLER